MPTRGERKEFERLKALFEPKPAPDPAPAEPDDDDEGQIIVFTGKKADRFAELLTTIGTTVSELLPGGNDDEDQGDDDDQDDDEEDDVEPDPTPAPRNRFFATGRRG